MQSKEITGFLFNQTSANRPTESKIQSKKQSFRHQIRRGKIQEYQAKIRAKLFYKNQQNYNLLNNINLPEDMIILAFYQYSPSQKQSRDEISIDQCNLIYDLEKPQNQKLKKALEEIFLYSTSSMSTHVHNLMQEPHILKLAQILEKKVLEMKPFFKQKSYKFNKPVDNLILPLIYQRVLVILTQWSFDQNIYFEGAYKYLIYVFNQTLHIFPSQTRVVQCCMYNLGNSLQKESVLQNLIQRLNEQNYSKCVLSKILNIFEHETQNFSINSYHSTTIIRSVLYFYAKLFMNIKITDLYPQYRKRLFNTFYELMRNKQSNQQILLQAVKSLLQLYERNTAQFSDIVLQTQKVFGQIVEGVYKIIKILKKNQVKQVLQVTRQLCIKSFNVLNIIFSQAGSDQGNFEQVALFLGSQIDQRIDMIMQDGLKSKETFVIYYTLQLVKVVCLWGDFVVKVYQNPNIMAKLFYYSGQENIKFKTQALSCLCNIIESYFSDKNYYDSELYEMYQNIVERYGFLEILVQNIDKYTDFQPNRDMLNVVKILSLFWECDPQLLKPNRFWIKFLQIGGQLKLNTIVSEERNRQLQQIATQILDKFTGKQIQI